jgi:hypothetical protein
MTEHALHHMNRAPLPTAYHTHGLDYHLKPFVCITRHELEAVQAPIYESTPKAFPTREILACGHHHI